MSAFQPFARTLRIALPALLLAGTTHAQNVAINSTGAAPATQALLDVSSTTMGMLVPRMTAAQRVAIPTPDQGLTVYQTDAPKGFYYYQGGVWMAVGTGGGVSWDLAGNLMTVPAATHPNPDFLGPTNGQPLVFRTNNVERMRLLGTNGYLGVGTVTPVERLDVNGGLRVFNDHAVSGQGQGSAPVLPLDGVPPFPTYNFVHSLTNSPGVLMYQHVPYRVGEPAAAWVGDTVMWAGHWGNTTGTAASTLPGSAAAPPHPGGWQRLGNDYNEVVRPAAASWNHPPGALCASAGQFTIPAAGHPSGGTGLNSTQLVSPFGMSQQNSVNRQQYLFLAPELNLELSGGSFGLCADEPINSIGFFVNSTAPKTYAIFSITVKNVPASFTALNTLLPITDPMAGCFFATNYVLVVSNGWVDIPLGTPFQWDGVSNVVVEFAGRMGTTPSLAAEVAVHTPAPGINRTYTVHRGAPCGTGATSNCGGALNIPGNMTVGSCTGATVGPSQTRPVIRFGGQIATQDPGIAISGTGGRYIQYAGGFMVETVTAGLPWGRKMSAPYTFRGPGTLVAEKGVYDNGVRLNDHVFDRAFDGRVHPSDAPVAGDQRTLPIAEMAAHTRKERHLPTMKGRTEWEAEGGFSLGDLTNQLWTTTETHALYLTELHDRLNALEALANQRPLSATEAGNTRAELLRMRTLTDAEKALLTGSVSDRSTPVHTTR